MSRAVAALDYAGRGWPVVPLHSIDVDGRCTCSRPACSTPGKHPRTQHGGADATSDAEAVRAWWKQCPDANVGIKTGRESGIVVLDVDPRNGGHDSLDKLERDYGPLPHTVESITGGSGRHVIFRHPDVPCRNSAQQLGRGLDVRGDGGYIVAPPSNHASGERYEWKPSCHPDEVELAPLPAWLLQRVTDHTRRDSTQGVIPVGERNTTLTSQAGAMRRAGLEEEAMYAALAVVNETRCAESVPDSEVRAIVHSVGKYPVGILRTERPAPFSGHRWPTLPMLSVEELLTLPPRKWLVNGHLWAGSTGVLYGPPGDYKSFLALDMSLSLAGGVPWLGEFAVSSGPVLYVAGEGVHGIGVRVAAWQAAHQEVNLAGFRVIGGAVQLLHADEQDALLARAREVAPVLIVIDTLARCFDGSENSTDDMMRFVNAVERIGAETSAAMLVVHHTGKEGRLERGSTALRAAVDTMMSLKRSTGSVATLTCTKQKDSESFEPIKLRLVTVASTDSCVLQPAAGNAETDQLTGKQMTALHCLAESFGAEGATYGDWLKASRLTKSTFDRATSALRRLALVSSDRGPYTVTESGMRLVVARRPSLLGDLRDAPDQSHSLSHPVRGGSESTRGSRSGDTVAQTA